MGETAVITPPAGVEENEAEKMTEDRIIKNVPKALSDTYFPILLRIDRSRFFICRNHGRTRLATDVVVKCFPDGTVLVK